MLIKGRKLIVSTNSNSGTIPTSFAQLAAMTLQRHVGNPIITYQANTWKGRQVHFPCCVIDPTDSSKLLIFYGGGDVNAFNFSIGLATAPVSDPFNWTEYSGNPILYPPNYGLTAVVGPDAVFWDAATSKFYLYTQTYTSDITHYFEGLWFSTDNINWTYQGAALQASDDEIAVGNPGFIIEGSTWYMYYTYRTASQTLGGIRLATSTDRGITWTKQGQILSIGAAYDNSHIEGLQALKVGNDYVLNYGCSFINSQTGLDEYCVAYAYSTSPTGGFTKWSGNPFFTKGTSGWDSTQISTGIFNTLTTPWTFFYQGTSDSGDYQLTHWSMGGAMLIN